jgi:hypothetical protein
VVEGEPLADEEARRHPGIIFTPHAAYYSVEGYVEMRRKGVEEVIRALRNEPVRNPVNLAYLQDARCRDRVGGRSTGRRRIDWSPGALGSKSRM